MRQVLNVRLQFCVLGEWGGARFYQIRDVCLRTCMNEYASMSTCMLVCVHRCVCPFML